MSSDPVAEKAVFSIARHIRSREARAEYLQQACGNDSQMLGRVSDLLLVHEQEQSFLEVPAAAREVLSVAATTECVAAERSGTMIGPQ
jgi:hypothetical protein